MNSWSDFFSFFIFGASSREKMSRLFSQSILLCRRAEAGLTLIYVVFTLRPVRFAADDPAISEIRNPGIWRTRGFRLRMYCSIT